MGPSPEVFDNEEVQWHVRKQAAHLTSLVLAIVSLTVVGFMFAWTGFLSAPLVGGMVMLGWAGGIAWISPRRRRLRRVAWCLKLSPSGVVTYDYARQQTTLTWADVQRVDLTSRGLMLIGTPAHVILVPHLFPNFSDLSHAVVRLAESHHVPIYIDGKPWESVDVFALFPFLEEVA